MTASGKRLPGWLPPGAIGLFAVALVIYLLANRPTDALIKRLPRLIRLRLRRGGEREMTPAEEPATATTTVTTTITTTITTTTTTGEPAAEEPAAEEPAAEEPAAEEPAAEEPAAEEPAAEEPAAEEPAAEEQPTA